LRKRQRQRPGGLEVDHQLEFGRLLDRNVARIDEVLAIIEHFTTAVIAKVAA